MPGILKLERGAPLKLNDGLLPINLVGEGTDVTLTLVRGSSGWMVFKQDFRQVNVLTWKQLIEIKLRGDGSRQYTASMMTLCCSDREVIADISGTNGQEKWKPPMAAIAEMPEKRLALGGSFSVVVNPRMNSTHDVKVSFMNVRDDRVSVMMATHTSTTQPYYFKNTTFRK
jgi:hypothetical protein